MSSHQTIAAAPLISQGTYPLQQSQTRTSNQGSFPLFSTTSYSLPLIIAHVSQVSPIHLFPLTNHLSIA